MFPGTREHVAKTDLSDILPEDVEEKVKEAAEISMGTEISDDDIINIQHLCEQVNEMNVFNYKSGMGNRYSVYEILNTVEPRKIGHQKSGTLKIQIQQKF